MLSGQVRSIDDLSADDARRHLNRWNVPENFAKNLEIVDSFTEIGKKKGVTSSQLALAWVLKQGEDIIPIPGTKRIKYLEENVDSAKVELSEEEEREIRQKVNSASVAGQRDIAGVLNVFADTPAL